MENLESEAADFDIEVMFPGRQEPKMCVVEFNDRRTNKKVTVKQEKAKLFNDENIKSKPDLFNLVMLMKSGQEKIMKDDDYLEKYIKDLSKADTLIFQARPPQDKAYQGAGPD